MNKRAWLPDGRTIDISCDVAVLMWCLPSWNSQAGVCKAQACILVVPVLKEIAVELG